jgi:hypothetical protein
VLRDIGLQGWIGAIELSFVLDKLLGVRKTKMYNLVHEIW